MIRTANAVLPVADIDAACAFVKDCLGFETLVRREGHAYCERGDAGVHFINAPPDADMDDPSRQLVIYMDCDDVDALWAEREQAIQQLPASHRDAPGPRANGQREFHLIHGPFLFIAGQPIAKDEAP